MKVFWIALALLFVGCTSSEGFGADRIKREQPKDTLVLYTEQAINKIRSTGEFGRVMADVMEDDLNNGAVKIIYIKKGVADGDVTYTGGLKAIDKSLTKFNVVIRSTLNTDKIAHRLIHEWQHIEINKNLFKNKKIFSGVYRNAFSALLSGEALRVEKLERSNERFLAAAFIFFSEAQAYEANYYLVEHGIPNNSLPPLRDLPLFIDENYINSLGMSLGSKLRMDLFRVLASRRVNHFNEMWAVLTNSQSFEDLFIKNNTTRKYF